VLWVEDRGNPTFSVMLPPSHEIRVLCNVIILLDINLPYGFCERVTDVLDSLSSQVEGMTL
jgi:hypothetical protein